MNRSRLKLRRFAAWRSGYVKIFILMCTLLLSVFLLSSNAAIVLVDAEEEADGITEEELNMAIGELLDSLDVEQLQNYLDSLSDFASISVKEKLMEVISGDFSVDYSSLGEMILDLIWEEAETLIPAFAVVLAVALLCGILNSAKSGFMNSTMSDMINFVGYISVGAVALSCLITVLSSGFFAIQNMQTQMEIVYPILLTLMAASGGTVSAAVYQPAAAFMSGAISSLFSSVILPLSIIVIVLSFTGNLSDDVRTEKLGEFFKSVNKWLIGFTLGLFGVFLTIQGLTSAQYDGLSLRAVKYVISGSVPLVGGFLSGSVDFIIAGSALIKNALGAFSIFLLAGTLLKPLLLFGVFQLFLRICAAATEPAGGKISAFLSRLAGDMGYFVAGLLSVAFLYFLTLLLLVCSSGVFF